MKLNRKKNTIRNAAFGTMYRVANILGPFVVRTVMIYIMGNEYVGLNSLFTSLLSFLSLAELGVGSALVFSMYKPIAEDDTESINALYALYKKVYRIIGFIIFGIGIAIIPILPLIVKSDLPPDVNLYALYMIYLVNTTISYWLFGYKQSLLTAFQRSDIVSKRSLVITMIMYAVQIAALYLTRNYYVYIICLPVATVFTNIANKIIVDKMFPQYKCEGKVSKEVENSIKKKVIALFGTKANAIVLHATDNIVISAFLGLTVVGMYGNYFYIMNSICLFIRILYDSMTAGLGNSLETETLEKNYSDFNMLSFMNAWIVTFAGTCLLCLYQPFMMIWVKEKNMFGDEIVILLVVYFFVYMIRRVILTYKDAAGIWWEDRFRPYAVMAVNLILNITLVQIIGLPGIIISTVVSMFVAIPWENYTVFKYIFKTKSGNYYRWMFIYTAVAIGIMVLCWFLCRNVMQGVLGLIIRLAICTVVANGIWIVLFFKKKEFRKAKRMLLRRR